MKTMNELAIGIVGAAGRGGTFRDGISASQATIKAVCDIREDVVSECARKLGAGQTYTNYEEMLDNAGLDAVIIGTPMHLHVPQSIAALERGIHVLCEVPAGISIEECRNLVQACRQSNAIYMMAENYVYTRENQLIKEMVAQGLFGTTYYAEAEYLHELKDLNEETPWRRKWQTGINGITYGTHSLGPILSWNPDDRVVAVSCAGSGHHYTDPRGALYENEDSCVMLCRFRQGGLAKIRVDMLSNRPHAMTNYTLQGTAGSYESARSEGAEHRIWLASRSPKPNEWDDLKKFENEFLPNMWRNPPKEALAAGHGGGDYFQIQDFFRAVRGEIPCPIDIDKAMDMTLPGLISQNSIAQNSIWLPVPDSREW